MILLIGGSGHVGSFVARLLAEQGLEFKALVREGSDVSGLQELGVRLVTGDIADQESLRRQIEQGGDTPTAVIFLPIIYSCYPLLNALRGSSVKRAVFIGSTGIFSKVDNESKRLKVEAEQAIRESDLEYAILRPTLIYGSHRDRNLAVLIRLVKRYPVFPVPGEGSNLLQPVYVEDVANGVVSSLSSEKTIRRVYNVAGPDAVSLNDLLAMISSYLGVRRAFVHLPLSLSALLVSAARAMNKKFRFDRDMILRLSEDKVFKIDDAREDFGYAPRSLSEGLRLEIQELRENGYI